MSDQETRVFGDRYELVRHIARGGMAQVYLARDLLLDRPVALKVLFPELSVDRSFVERFRREAQAAANLSHPNIVSIYDWGQGEHTYYIVMEYIDGETLSARIRRGPLSADQAAIVGIATASALAFAHRRQVIHRDVKPGNVLIDRSGQVKVADFGIARAVGTAEDLTQAGSVMGTATYFSPEQAQGQVVDARSDVYSLGVVLYEMVVGKAPFQGDSPVAIAYKHVREAPPAPRTANPAVPAGFEAIVLEAMAKDPAARYQSADDLRADLERFRSGQPVLAGAAATTVVAGAAVGTTRVNQTVDPTTVSPAAATIAPTTMGPPPSRATFEEPKSRRWLWALLILALLILLAVLGYFIGRDLGLFAKTLTVPSVQGQPKARAESTLHGDGFTSVSTKTVTSTTTRGDAVGTDPKAGSRIKSDSNLTLLVSGGPGTVPVPPVAGDPEAQAKTVLTHSGFKVSTATQPSASVRKGYAIRTSPQEGTVQARGSTVELIVSSGPAEVTIPPLARDSPAAAGAALSKLGLGVGSQQTEASGSVPTGEVTRTSPPAGTRVATGTTVTIYVSSGPSQVQVPPILGDSQSAAEAALNNAGLTGNFTNVPVTDPGQNGKVQSTNPPPGAMVAPGSAVTVDLGSYTAPSTTVPSTTTTTTSTVPGTG